MRRLLDILWYLKLISGSRRRGSPLVEESILLGISLFAFMILATIVFDLVDFAKAIFDQVTDGLDKFPG
ncbi:MAG: hypothetical protein ACXAE3_04000 [Candidatus Kariarchaeaceae archaeon]